MALWILSSQSSQLIHSKCRRFPKIIPRGRGQQVNCFYSQPEEFLMTRVLMMLRLLVFLPAAVICHAPTETNNRRNRALSFGSDHHDVSSTTAWPPSNLLNVDAATRGSPCADSPPIFWSPPRTIKITVCLESGVVGTEEQGDLLSQPLIKTSALIAQSGEEFQRKPDLVRKLALMGERVASNDGSDEWIKWKLTKHDLDGVSVWTGKAQKEGYYGSQLPLIKSRSIIPLSCKDMVDLMMDSSKVPIYNTWSMGRKDCWVLDDHTKIVQNRVKPPIGSKQLVSTSLLHACPLDNDAWVIVSRAVRGFPEPEDASKTEILLGVNLVEPVGDNSCRLTSVNHVYTSGVPTMLAESLGVKSAIKFVHDLRRLRGEGKI